jgi:hypothetical protein
LFADRLDKLTLEFLELLNKRRDLMLLPSVLRAYREAYFRFAALCRPTSRRRVRRPRSRIGPSGKRRGSCSDRNGGDRDGSALLLGGFTIETRERIYDYSLSGRLDRLKRRLTHA